MPVLPGSPEPLADEEGAAAQAAKIGYPVVLKAPAGGGGRGIVPVHEPARPAEAFGAARCAGPLRAGAPAEDHRGVIGPRPAR
ncbi:hypothetical protein [Nonomuraea sp. NPDC049625]|uniref:ATP-binding protein n=1 Tax=Nonomuraea sp. NPDC049625 TaxID=3155775 RepID=UPI00341FAC72